MSTIRATNAGAPGSGTTTSFMSGLAVTWICWNEVTSTTNTVSINITSLTDNGTGDTTLTYTNAFSSNNYCTAGGGRGAAGSIFINQDDPDSIVRSTTALRHQCYNQSATATDAGAACYVWFGALA